MLGWQEGDRGRAQETTQEEKLEVREEGSAAPPGQ